MLRVIFAAVVSALKSLARVAGALVMAPLRMIDRLAGGGCEPALPQIDLPPPFESKPVDHTAVYAAIADAVMRWACDSVIDDKPASAPPGLSIAVREWLPGLTRDECEAIVDCDKADVLAHIRGKMPIVGVRTVQRLPRIEEWPARKSEPTPHAEIGSPSFSEIAVYGAR